MTTTAPVIALDHPAALDVARVGRKAANLAAARAAGLPVAPGVVLTTDWASTDEATAALVWRITSHDGARSLVVRTSATSGDWAPQHGDDAIEAATVVADLASMLAAVAVRRADDDTMPILLQPHLAGAWQGALFADEDARGWRATPLAVARAAGATVDEDWIAVLDHTGRVRDVMSAQPVGGPPADVLVRLARLGERVAAAFDGPHDLEWIADADGRLQLLRVRPLLRLRSAPSTGPALPASATLRSQRSLAYPDGSRRAETVSGYANELEAVLDGSLARRLGRSRQRRSAHHEPALVSSPVDESAA